MSDFIDDDALQETLKDAYKTSQMANDAPEYKQARSIIRSIYFKLYSEKRTLENDKQTAKEKDNRDDHWLVQIQSMLDFVNELLNIDGLEELAQQPNPVEKKLDARERISMLQIISALAAEAGLELDKHSKAAETLLAVGAKHGLELPKKKDTIAGKFKEARDLQKTR